jgi:hypothetical protein
MILKAPPNKTGLMFVAFGRTYGIFRVKDNKSK